MTHRYSIASTCNDWWSWTRCNWWLLLNEKVTAVATANIHDAA